MGIVSLLQLIYSAASCKYRAKELITSAAIPLDLAQRYGFCSCLIRVIIAVGVSYVATFVTKLTVLPIFEGLATSLYGHRNSHIGSIPTLFSYNSHSILILDVAIALAAFTASPFVVMPTHRQN